MTKTRIGVVRGGPSNEYDVSLKTGAAVLDALDREKYEPLDIVISKDGTWHLHGLETKPREVRGKVDVVFNALHGYYGEDGKIQQILEEHRIPFTGSGSLSSALCMNKALSKDYFQQAGLKTPAHVLLEKRADGNRTEVAQAYLLAHSKFPLPYIIKPVSGGSSLGVILVKNRDKFAPALTKAYLTGDSIMIEEFASGVEASVGVIEGFRGKDMYALPPIEIRPHKGNFFDYETKYGGGSNEIVPATFSPSIKKELERLAIAAHEALGLSHYSRSDFIISPRRGIFILETNSLPGLTNESLLPKALAAVGSSLSDFTDHMIQLALDESR